MWPGREVDHSPPSSADVKNMWSYTSFPPRRRGVHKDKFTCTVVILQGEKSGVINYSLQLFHGGTEFRTLVLAERKLLVCLCCGVCWIIAV